MSTTPDGANPVGGHRSRTGRTGRTEPGTGTGTAGLNVPGYVRDHGTHPPLDYPGYNSTALRHPRRPLTLLPHMLTEITSPVLGEGRLGAHDHDLTRQRDGEPQGQRVIVHGQVRDSDGRPVPRTLVEIWQANAAGRYLHTGDSWPAPLDPHFTGVGRALTDPDGHYRFVTVRPGAYPWKNHHNAWRPAHIHFSLFGRAFTQRLVTQMYFPDDPLFFQDPMWQSVPDERARERMLARFDYDATEPEWALAYRWDIVLRGREQTPFESEEEVLEDDE